MFGLFGKRTSLLGTYSIRVYRNNVGSVSVDYQGERLQTSHSLFLCGLYASKTMYTTSNKEVTAIILSAVARSCIQLDEGESADLSKPISDLLGVSFSLVSSSRSLVERYTEFKVDVIKGRNLDLPVIQTHLPHSPTHGDLIISVAGFIQHWLDNNNVKSGTFAADSFLNFFGGFLSYYEEDPAAFLDVQSIYQAPMKGFMYSRVSSLMWPVDDDDN